MLIKEQVKFLYLYYWTKVKWWNKMGILVHFCLSPRTINRKRNETNRYRVFHNPTQILTVTKSSFPHNVQLSPTEACENGVWWILGNVSRLRKWSRWTSPCSSKTHISALIQCLPQLNQPVKVRTQTKICELRGKWQSKTIDKASAPCYKQHYERIGRGTLARY